MHDPGVLDVPREIGEKIYGCSMLMAPKRTLRSDLGLGEASISNCKKGKGVMRYMSEW